jgi:hypothetical protein
MERMCGVGWEMHRRSKRYREQMPSVVVEGCTR